jgi:hypothetical protein
VAIETSDLSSNPFLVRPSKAAEKQDEMRLELEGSFDNPNPELWGTFFPGDDPACDGDKILQSLKASGLYGNMARQSARASVNRSSGKAAANRPPGRGTGNRSSIKATTSRSSVRATRRSAQGTRRRTLTHGWKDIPQHPKSNQNSIKEKDITAALVPIINAIISLKGLSETRIAVDCQDHGIPTFDDNDLKPGVFLWGKGSPVFQSVDGIPPSSLRSSKDGKLMDNIHFIDWRWCVIPIEMKTERSRYEDNDKAMFQLATYIREVFKASLTVALFRCCSLQNPQLDSFSGTGRGSSFLNLSITTPKLHDILPAQLSWR